MAVFSPAYILMIYIGVVVMMEILILLIWQEGESELLFSNRWDSSMKISF